MGIVYLAHDLEMNRRVAFKVVRPAPQEGEPDSATTPMALSPPTGDSPGAQTFEDLTTRFLQEAWITGGMEHPGIAPVYELGRTKGGIPFYTMRYIRGKRTLAEAFAECKNLDDRLDLLEPFLRVCDTIRYAHSRGVLHRDLKPRNIALGEYGEAIVLDWGLSKVKGQADKTSGIWQSRIQEFRDATDLKTVAGAFGTPGYMAPESLTGAPDATDEQSDVYSLGAILFELLTGKLPFEFSNFMEYVNLALNNEPRPAHERDPAVPEDLSAICARALMLHKEERFKSVDVLAKSVRRWRTEGAKDRAIGELYKKALAEVEAAEGLQGSALLRHVDRASATCGRLLADRPEHHGGLELLGIIKSLRQRGIHEREEAARRKLLHTIGLLLLITLSVAMVFVAISQKDNIGDSGATAEAPVTAGAGANAEIRRLQTELVASKQRESSRRARLGEAYTSLSKSLLDEGRVGAARVAAAYSLTIGDSIAAWTALAHAERKSAWWTSVVQTGTPVNEFAIANELGLMFWVTSGD